MNLIQLQPDDVLVLRTPGRMDQAQRDAALAGLRSYLGPDRKVIFLDAGETLDVLRCAASDAAQTDQDGAQRAIWRQEYNALPPADREAYGGFAGFVEAQGGFDPYAPQDEEPPALPPHVWLYRKMLTDHQIESDAPLFRDEANGQYAVAVDDLTDEQRAIPHVAAQLAPVGTLELKIEGLV